MIQESVEDPVKPLMSYADVVKGKGKSATWKKELATKATRKHDEALLKEVQQNLIK